MQSFTPQDHTPNLLSDFYVQKALNGKKSKTFPEAFKKEIWGAAAKQKAIWVLLGRGGNMKSGATSLGVSEKDNS